MSIPKVQAQRLSGINPLAYMGVDPLSPPNLIKQNRPPDANDVQNVTIGDFWMVNNAALAIPLQLYQLFNKVGAQATWGQLYPSGAAAASIFNTDNNGPVTPLANTVAIKGDPASIVTDGFTPHQVTLYLRDDVTINNSLTIPVMGGVFAGVCQVDSTGKLFSNTGANGQILIGTSVVGDTALWGEITSAGGTIVVSNLPNGINLEAVGTGSGAINFRPDQGGDAIALGGSIALAGGNNIVTVGSNPGPIPLTGVVTIGLTDDVAIINSLTVNTFGRGMIQSTAAGLLSSINGTDGQLLIGKTGADASWQTLISGDASVTFAYVGSTLDIRAVGGGASGVTSLTGDSGGALTGVLKVKGSTNIVTAAAGTDVTVSLKDSVLLPDTISASVGVIGIGATSLTTDRFLHKFGHAGNTFVGRQAGNFTMSGANNNTGCGANSLDALTSGDSNSAHGVNSLSACTSGIGNSALGYNCLDALQTGNYNTAGGYSSLGNITTGSYNLVLGWSSGSNLVTSSSHNLLLMNTGVAGDANTTRIGTQGSGNGQQNKCFIAGINGVTSSNEKLVSINSVTGQLGVVSLANPYGVLYANGATVGATTAGVAGEVLTSNGAGVPPTYQASGGGIAMYFLARQDGNVSNVIGNGVPWRLGTLDNGGSGSSALTSVTNVGGGVMVLGGPATPWSYTVPAGGDGLWCFNFGLNVTNEIAPTWKHRVIYLHTTLTNFHFDYDRWTGATSGGGIWTNITRDGTAIAYMQAGDTVTLSYTGENTTATLQGCIIGGTVSTDTITWIGGYKIK